MSRNSSGTYSLPAGNPVVPGTVISSSWANTTLSDIANALTDSLSRTGQGGMQAPLALDDGTVALPALTWTTEQTSGLYRAGAGDIRYSIGATDVVTITAALTSFLSSRVRVGSQAFSPGATDGVFTISSNQPNFYLYEADAAANNRSWRQVVSGESLIFQIRADDDSAGLAWLTVDRTGATTVDTINFNNGTLQYGGVEVGLRPIARDDMTTSRGTLAADNGRLILFLGAAGQTLTLNGLAQGTTILVQNYTNTLAIVGAGGVTVTWANGAGAAMPTGARTLARGGVMTVWYPSAVEAIIWGIGIT